MPQTDVTVVLDWGTTSFRAFLVGPDEAVLDSRQSARGIQTIATGDHAGVLAEVIVPWRARHGALAIIAAGMIGSRNGWVEMPYVATPASPGDLAAASRTIDLPDGDRLTFVPGLTDRSAYPYPDVMRGEEAQLVGLGVDRALTVVLPGTHSKWARVGGGVIDRFRTFVTGELFATLSSHSFIAKVATGAADHRSVAFLDGVTLAMAEAKRAGGLLNRLFAVRTGWLAGEVDASQMRSRLSGILVGWEFAEAKEAGWFDEGDTIAIVGNDDLTAVYSAVASAFGLEIELAPADAALRGALAIARLAGNR